MVPVLFAGSAVADGFLLPFVESAAIAMAKLSESEGKSIGISFGVSDMSECSPIGFNGRRNVPLLGLGSMDRESQTIL